MLSSSARQPNRESGWAVMVFGRCRKGKPKCSSEPGDSAASSLRLFTVNWWIDSHHQLVADPSVQPFCFTFPCRFDK